jgi:excisionase family DNA binding protein
MRQLEQAPAIEPGPGAADPDQKFARPEAAKYLGISARTLEGWAVRGGGPRMLKLGSRVVYRRRDLDAWLATRERASTSDRGPAA